jgi:hypothetical protein
MMAHPFLAEIDVLELERKALPAPYVPLIEDEGDGTSNFQKRVCKCFKRSYGYFD